MFRIFNEAYSTSTLQTFPGINAFKAIRKVLMDGMGDLDSSSFCSAPVRSGHLKIKKMPVRRGGQAPRGPNPNCHTDFGQLAETLTLFSFQGALRAEESVFSSLETKERFLTSFGMTN